MNAIGGFTCYLISKMFLGDIVHNKLRDKFESLSDKVRTTFGNNRWMYID